MPATDRQALHTPGLHRISAAANNAKSGNVRSHRRIERPRFAGLFWLHCKPCCRSAQPSEGRPILGTHVRLQANANDPSDRRRRPDDRLRHARRVRAGARWEHSAELRVPHPSPGPHSLLGAAAARRRSSIRPRLRPLFLLSQVAPERPPRLLAAPAGEDATRFA